MRQGLLYQPLRRWVHAAPNRRSPLYLAIELLARRHEQWRHQQLRDAMSYCGPDVVFDGRLWVLNPKRLSMGAGCTVACYTTIWATGGVTIGERVMISSCCAIASASHPMNAAERATGLVEPSPVVIGDRAWLGAGVSVLPGVTIGRDAVIGAGAVVTRDVAPGAVVGGVPARDISASAKPLP